MARKGDYYHREPKKPKKGAKKPKGVSNIFPPPMAVEVIRKGKKPKGAEAEEQREK